MQWSLDHWTVQSDNVGSLIYQYHEKYYIDPLDVWHRELTMCMGIDMYKTSKVRANVSVAKDK